MSDTCPDDDFEPSATPCDSWEQERCSDGGGCWTNVESQTYVKYCSGTSSPCDGETVVAASWHVTETCSDDERCVVVTSGSDAACQRYLYCDGDCTIYVDSDGDDSHDGTSWARAVEHLNTGISMAKSVVDTESTVEICEVWVKTGTYSPGLRDPSASFQLEEGVHVYGGFAGTEASVAERVLGANETTLSGDVDFDGRLDEDNARHVVRGADNAVLDGFTIKDGYGYEGYTAYTGAGMLNIGVSPTVRNCVFRRNTANSGGGAMMNGNSSPLIVNCVFEDNSVVGYGQSSSATGMGAAVYNVNSEPTIVNSVFRHNSASVRVDITNPDWTRSPAARAYGGAMANDNSSPVLVNTVLFDNEARGYVRSNASARAYAYAYGGAMYNMAGSAPVIINSTFYANRATAGADARSYTLAARGGALNNDASSPTITNSIFWGDSADTSGDEFYDYNATPVVSYSDVQGGYPGTQNLNVNPLFSDPASGVLSLLASSPCVEAGDSAAVPSDAADLDGDGDRIEPVPWDIDGHDRIQGDVVDMGAYEVPW